MHRVLLSVLLSAVLVAVGSSAAFALQSGGVEIGDLETGSVVGQSFNALTWSSRPWKWAEKKSGIPRQGF